MLIIPIKDGENIDKALKRFKRKFDKTGVMRSLRERKQFVKPSVEHRNKIIKDIGYDCKSCVFCQASVNLLSKKIVNMNSDKAFDLCNDAINFYKSKENKNDQPEYEECLSCQ